MAEPKIVEFKPRWMQDLTEEDRAILSDAPRAGVAPPSLPRVDSRIVFPKGRSGISARALEVVLHQTQTVASHAGCDLYYGFDLNFTDLRSAGAEVLELARLTIEPGEEGSYVLPARLEAPPIEVVEAEKRRRITTEDVVRRFAEILTAVGSDPDAATVSLGALRAIEELGAALNKEGGLIEYRPADTKGNLLSEIVVKPDYLDRVREIRETRQATRMLEETLDGMLTAIDLDEETFLLRLEGSSRRVKGTFSRMLHPGLTGCLGEEVRLHGQVTRRGRTIQAIKVERFERAQP